jgi:hypothetical protein
MKMNIAIDCTPDEARQAFGLPDVKPIQAAMMAKMEADMNDAIDRFSPDALLQTWMLTPASSFQEMFQHFVQLGSPYTAKRSDRPE